MGRDETVVTQAPPQCASLDEFDLTVEHTTGTCSGVGNGPRACTCGEPCGPWLKTGGEQWHDSSPLIFCPLCPAPAPAHYSPLLAHHALYCRSVALPNSTHAEALRRLTTSPAYILRAERRDSTLEYRHCERPTANMPTTLKEFEAVFPKLVDDLKAHCQKYNSPEQALKWCEEVGYSPPPPFNPESVRPLTDAQPLSPSPTTPSAGNVIAASLSSTPPESSSTATSNPMSSSEPQRWAG